MNAWTTGVTAALLAAGCWTDLKRMIIPNRLTAGFAAAGLVCHLLTGGWMSLALSLAGGAAGMLPLLLLNRLKGLGAGDVKWFGAFGIWAGVIPALQLIVYSILIAGGLSILLLLLRLPGIRKWGERLPWAWGRHPAIPGKGAAFPFMLAVTPGFIWMICSMGGGMD